MTPKRRRGPHGPEHDALGRAVRELRGRLGMSQQELGDRADLHRNYIGAVERGEINPTWRVLMKVCRGLRVQLSELILYYEYHAGIRRRPRL